MAPAWELLTRLHRFRRVAPPSDVLMALFQRTRALAGFRLRRGGDQALANLWKTVDLARAYEAAGPATLRTVVRFLEEERRAGTDEGDSPVGEQAGLPLLVMTNVSRRAWTRSISSRHFALNSVAPTLAIAHLNWSD